MSLNIKHTMPSAPTCVGQRLAASRQVVFLGFTLNKSFVGVQGAVFQKSPLTAGGK